MGCGEQPAAGGGGALRVSVREYAKTLGRLLKCTTLYKIGISLLGLEIELNLGLKVILFLLYVPVRFKKLIARDPISD